MRTVIAFAIASASASATAFIALYLSHDTPHDEKESDEKDKSLLKEYGSIIMEQVFFDKTSMW